VASPLLYLCFIAQQMPLCTEHVNCQQAEGTLQHLLKLALWGAFAVQVVEA
jgi:hypothetical protein